MVQRSTDEEYYSNVRDEILPLLPVRCDRVLDIGCGYGSTLLWLKEHRKCTWGGGVRYGNRALRRE